MRSKTIKKLLVSFALGLFFTFVAGNIAYAAGKPAINKTSLDLLVGKTYDLNIKNTAKNAAYEWSSNNQKIATVDKNGLVKGKAKGDAVITCKVKSSGQSYSLKAEVHVIAPAKTVSIPDNTMQLKVGETVALTYKVSPSSSNDKITWNSDDKTVAAIDKNGKLTAKKVGITKITAVTLSGVKDTISVAVYDESVMVITTADVKDKKVIISDQIISNLYIDHSVKYADITLNNVKITGTLELVAGTEYIVKADNSTIAAANVITTKDPSTMNEIEMDMPTLFAGDKTNIWKTSLQGCCVLKESDSSNIDSLSISPAFFGECDLYISGYHGNVVVDYDSITDVYVELEGCIINKVDVTKANGYYLKFSSNEETPSNIKTINIKAKIMCGIYVETDTVNIDKNLKEDGLIIANKITKLVNNGTDVGFVVAEDANIGEIVDNKSSKGNNGTYTFQDSDTGKISFTVNIGGFPIVVQLQSLSTIFQSWTDQSKPYQLPDFPGVTITCTSKNNYELNIYGAEFPLVIDLENGFITIPGSDAFKLTDIVIVK